MCEEFLAGQDSRLRIFSLRTGLALAAPPAPSPSWSPGTSSSTRTPSDEQSRHVLARTFSAPIRSLAFSPLDPLRFSDECYTRTVLESADQPSPRWDCPSLWIAEGAGIECHAVQ